MTEGKNALAMSGQDASVDFPCDLLAAVGNTPLVELTRLNPNRQVRVFAKLEGNNPGGSVKDRPAAFMIMAAERQGVFSPGRTILERIPGT